MNNPEASVSYPIQSAEHALVAGMVVGLAIKHGIDLRPVVDEAGNYTAEALLVVPDLPDNVTVRLIIEPPVTEPIEADL